MGRQNPGERSPKLQTGERQTGGGGQGWLEEENGGGQGPIWAVTPLDGWILRTVPAE